MAGQAGASLACPAKAQARRLAQSMDSANAVTCMPDMAIRCAVPVAAKASSSSSGMLARNPTDRPCRTPAEPPSPAASAMRLATSARARSMPARPPAASRRRGCVPEATYPVAPRPERRSASSRSRPPGFMKPLRQRKRAVTDQRSPGPGRADGSYHDRRNARRHAAGAVLRADVEFHVQAARPFHHRRAHDAVELDHLAVAAAGPVTCKRRVPMAGRDDEAAGEGAGRVPAAPPRGKRREQAGAEHGARGQLGKAEHESCARKEGKRRGAASRLSPGQPGGEVKGPGSARAALSRCVPAVFRR
jgi:hypothetical protein